MRKIIVVLVVLCAKIAQAQIYIDSYRFAQAGPVNLLLDDYPGAAAAYSLRKLDKDYTGSAIRIRTAGGSETDIGFDSNGDLNTAAITTFCAGTTCTVATWYDQSGNGYNATAAAANQPTIYTGGAVVTISGKAAISFDGANDFLQNTVYSQIGQTQISGFSVTQNNTSSVVIDFGYDGNTSGAFYIMNNTGIYLTSGFEGRWDVTNNYLAISRFGTSTTSPLISGATIDGSLTKSYSSGVLRATGNPTEPYDFTSRIRIGSLFTPAFTAYYSFKISEFVIYHTDQTSNVTNIHSNQNSYYSIY